MTFGDLNWSTIHPSAYRETARMLRWANATSRPHGALRYCCPITGSFVLLTDDATLRELARPRARHRCPDCGEIHLLRRNVDSAVIVASFVGP